MTERYRVYFMVGRECVEHFYRHKGTAMGYISRKFSHSQVSQIGLEQQRLSNAAAGASYDEKTGLYWTSVQFWTFHKNGQITHRSVS